MQLYKLFLVKMLLIIVFLSGCSLINKEENIVKTTSLLKAKNHFFPVIAWRNPIGKGATSIGKGIGNVYSNLHPAYADGIVYAADYKGTVKAINADNNKEIWSVNLSEKDSRFPDTDTPVLLSGGVSVSDKYVYIGSEQAQVYALNNKDGSIVWKVQAAGEVLSCPIATRNGIVLVHTSNGQLQAFNEINGEVRWSISLDLPVFSLHGESSPAVVFGAAIVGSDDGYVSAILIQYGDVIWKQRISHTVGNSIINRLSDVDATPVVVNNVVYAVAYNGNLTALELQSGRIIWKRKLGSINNFIVNGNCIYLVDQDDRLLAINREDGTILWTQSNFLHRMLTAPVLYNENLVVGDSKGYIYWFNMENGQLICRKQINISGFFTDPIIADSKLLIQSNDGTLYAITYEFK